MEKQSVTLKESQERVDRFISQFEEGYFSPLSMMARFTEEMGELIEKLIITTEKSQKNQQKKRNRLKMS